MEARKLHDFVPSKIGPVLRARRLKVLAQSTILAPSYRVARIPRHDGQWALYFVYTPTGQIFDQHIFTIDRLKECGFRVLIVIGSDRLDGEVAEALKMADAVIIKEERGFDFSGYTIGLNYLVSRFGVFDVLVLNDSVFGPFSDLMPTVTQTRWRLTGFTSSQAIENHIQSYAFIFKAMDKELLASLSSVFFRRVAMSSHGAVGFLQESRLARRTSRTCSVGSLWEPLTPLADLTMAMPIELVKEGFPFLKRSLLGKFSFHFSRDDILAVLREKQHPVKSEKLFSGFID
jgi:lipopolysaccharide biosynthesis protein